MSYSLQTQEYWTTPPVAPDPTEANLRHELGWKEVEGGLSQILLGYGILTLNVLMIVGFIVMMVVHGAGRRLVRRGFEPDAGMAAMVLIGLVVILLATMYACWKIFVGKWRCAIHTPDRCGARWFIFACALCMVIGPAMGMLATVAQVTTVTEAVEKKKAHGRFVGFTQREEEKLVAEVASQANFTQCASSFVHQGVTIFFVLFLRAAGKCFRSWLLVFLSNLYLLISAAIIGLTIAGFYSIKAGKVNMVVITLLIICSLVSALWYVVLVFYARLLIGATMGRLKSPLEAA
jgi:hypothetical protein